MQKKFAQAATIVACACCSLGMSLLSVKHESTIDSRCCSFVQVLEDLQTDPKNSQHHLEHPQIRAKIDKLVSAGIVQLR